MLVEYIRLYIIRQIKHLLSLPSGKQKMLYLFELIYVY